MSRRAGRQRQLALAVLALAVLAALVARSDPREVWEAMTQVSALAIAVAVLLNIPTTALRAARTRRVLLCLGSSVPMRRMVPAQLAGQTLSWLTPAASGDLVRAWIWHRQDAVAPADGVVTVVYERLYSLLLLAAVGAAFLAPGALGPRGAVLTVVAIVAVAVLPWVAGATRPGRAAGRAALNVLQRLPGVRSRSAAVRRSARDVATLFATRRLGVEFTMLTLGIFALSGLQVLVLAHALGGDFSLAVAIGVYGLSQAGGSVSSLPFGLGAGDAIILALLTREGMALDSAAGVAVLLRATVTLPIAAAAALVAGRVVRRGDQGAEVAEEGIALEGARPRPQTPTGAVP